MSAVLLFTTVFAGWSPIVYATPAMTSDCRQVNAAQIVAEMGAGWNLGNQLGANINGVPSETAWGNPVVTQSLLNTVKAAGFKTVRIPVSYLSKTGHKDTRLLLVNMEQ